MLTLCFQILWDSCSDQRLLKKFFSYMESHFNTFFGALLCSPGCFVNSWDGPGMIHTFSSCICILVFGPDILVRKKDL